MVLLDHGGRHPSEVELLAPPPDVGRLVEHLWIQGRHGTVTDWRVVADTSPYLIASVTEVAGTRHMRIQLVGARTHAATVNVRNRVLTVGVRLRVGAIPVLTGWPARELTDKAAPIDGVFTPVMLADLELGHDAPPQVVARELIRLVRRVSSSDGIRPLIPNGRLHSVRELADWLQTAPRSLRDRMYRHAGLSPKRLLRLVRLHAALHAAWRQDSASALPRRRSWSDVAYLAGYADQAHLTREVRALLGETPSAWRARGSAVSFKTSSRR
jgi:AraC-like DNA-binding protein